MLDVQTIANTDSVLNEKTIRAFEMKVRGEVIRPSDAGYDEARQVWNAMIDKRPALIARCASAADVQATVHFARRHNLEVAVRGGGHSVAGQSTCDGGLVIDLSLMRGVNVDPGGRTARVQGGTTWGDVDRVTQAFGLAAPGGVVSTTGVAGLTLGGGYGWLRRRYGLSCDSLLSVDIVTADGRLLTASDTENADLLWGLRGGGGNFGIVTSFEFRLYPIGPEVMYAATMYPAEKAGHILCAWRDYVTTAPDEVTSDATLWTVPPIPDIPEELHGQQIVLIEAVYAAAVAAGERLLQPLRELDEPLLDMSEPVPYVVLQSALDELFPKGEFHHYWKSIYLNDLGDAAIDAIVARGVDRPSPKTLVPIRHLGGAMSRLGPEATAFGDRSAPYLLSIDSTWEDPSETEENITWTRAFWADMRRFSNGATYFNFPGLLEEGEALLQTTFGANYTRLIELKNKYDPTNLFRLNHNVNPTV